MSAAIPRPRRRARCARTLPRRTRSRGDAAECEAAGRRTRWIIAPGNDLYLVYTQNWQNLRADQLDQRFTTLSQGGITKLNYTFRF